VGLLEYFISMLKKTIKPKKSVRRKKSTPQKPTSRAAPVLMPVMNSPGKYIFFCPACQENHVISTVETECSMGHRLEGTLAQPTIIPSILSHGDKSVGKPRCHSFITKGKIKFMRDSGHAMAGKTVTLKPFD
jgi:hypothetical protein